MKSYLPLLLPLLLAGCGGKAATEAEAPTAVAQVRTGIAEAGASSDSVTVYGATEAGPGGERSVVAPAEAIIASIAAPTGTAVGAGQAIMLLRPSPASRLAIARAGTEAAAAQAAYARALRLRADGLVSNADVETARAAAAVASATRANLGIKDGGLVLRAPIAGTVRNLTARPGDQVAAGAAVATVAVQGDLRARFGVDSAIAQRLHPGQPIDIDTVNGNMPARVAMVGIDPQIDPATRLASIYVRIPAGLHLGAGEPLRATLQVGATSNGITIPYAALLDDGGRSYVFVVRNGVAKSRDVSPGNSSGDRVQILKGLQPGEKVVTEGGTALEDGMKVAEGAGAAR
ncbi:MAG: efflux RND transporter periplasmic adaptor subunit [Candidatus Sphingomonas phytovorans]|nr:efflux RND transporter periplasmic adaptor subunit [Sphingomonas sp.]WEJ99600.1 MAG: efflux RND transporter periplasmic adaptor subunit [Sphingomonas sp.]